MPNSELSITAFCPYSGQSHSDISTAFCASCGADCRRFKTKDVRSTAIDVDEDLFSTPSGHTIPKLRTGVAVQGRQLVNQRISDRKPSTGTSNIPSSVTFIAGVFHHNLLDKTWVRKGWQWTIVVPNVPTSLRNLTYLIRRQIQQSVRTIVELGDALTPTDEGEWQLSSIDPTGKEGPIFLTAPEKDDLIVSETVESSNLTPARGSKKCFHIYLCWLEDPLPSPPPLPPPRLKLTMRDKPKDSIIIPDDEDLGDIITGDASESISSIPDSIVPSQNTSRVKRARPLSLEEQQPTGGVATRGRIKKAAEKAQNKDQ
jgi:hypothetical protein